MTRVHVVMCNDYPFAVFSDGVKAASFVAAQPREYDQIPLHWKIYEFTLDER